MTTDPDIQRYLDEGYTVIAATAEGTTKYVPLCGAMGEDGDGPCHLQAGHPGFHSDGDAQWQ